MAYFEPDRHGGSTSVYIRNGSQFNYVELPQFPECKKTALKEGESPVGTVEETTAPQKWLSSGGLVLRVHSEELIEKGNDQFGRLCTLLVTVAFGSDGKASVQGVTQSRPD